MQLNHPLHQSVTSSWCKTLKDWIYPYDDQCLPLAAGSRPMIGRLIAHIKAGQAQISFFSQRIKEGGKWLLFLLPVHLCSGFAFYLFLSMYHSHHSVCLGCVQIEISLSISKYVWVRDNACVCLSACVSARLLVTVFEYVCVLTFISYCVFFRISILDPNFPSPLF